MLNTKKAKKRVNVKMIEAVQTETQERIKSASARRRKPRSGGFAIPKGMKVGRFIQIEVQKMMLSQDPKSTSPKTKLQTMLEAGYKRAIDMRSGQGKAITELLLAYGFEKPKPAEDELDAMAKSGFQVVYVNHPELKDVPRMEQLTEGKPEFIEGEVLEEER